MPPPGLRVRRLRVRSHDHRREARTLGGVSSFTADRYGRPADQVGYLGHPVTVETPPPPDETPRPKADGGRKKRAYRYPEWRRKRARKS